MIHSAILNHDQDKKARSGELATFTLTYSPDLKSIAIKLPFQQIGETEVLCGQVPDKSKSSLRNAIAAHRCALAPFDGISPRIEGHDEELYYQNILTRYVKPVLRISHILQVVWEAASEFAKEAAERNLPIDQILMRKAEWARDIDQTSEKYAGIAILDMRDLGIPACSCKLHHFRAPITSVS